MNKITKLKTIKLFTAAPLINYELLKYASLCNGNHSTCYKFEYIIIFFVFVAVY